MKIYTKTGDKGETGLMGGKRVSKGALRIQAYGEVDELNASLAVASSFLEQADRDILEVLVRLQEDLFVVGADLATPPDYRGKRLVPRIKGEAAERIEKLIDAYDEKLPKLDHFILPSGTQAGAFLHLARTVCRRAEREVARLSTEETVGHEVLKYLNRLSDFLFVLARTVNHRRGTPEIPWLPPQD